MELSMDNMDIVAGGILAITQDKTFEQRDL